MTEYSINLEPGVFFSTLVNNNKKGTTMTDQISEQMQEAHEVLAVNPDNLTENQDVFVQTEADVGSESDETRVD